MGTKVTRHALSELKTFRIHCDACNVGWIELPLSEIQRGLDHGKCRFCGASHYVNSPDLLFELARVIGQVTGAKALKVEFELPGE